ncbi:MAG: hypothetical protein ETSY1_44730 [Candidatus Entotheonella factor]|uniref:Glycosyltransferase 2-like domain-containing protein n=1 Tax=Entotheonella factor TaxID=1429438 RepID=W4L4E5_ENTF1|nr:MAG: hypothetical protein ETSY1_44730 [Candidatus Entotheonella factor]
MLPRVVESARKAGEDVEVVIVDDASIDETAKVCQTLEGIRYIRLDQNQGVAGARNVGILGCSGDYITFLDDDDLRLPGSLDLQLKALEAAPEAGFVYGRVIEGDDDCNPTSTARPQHCPTGDIFWQVLGWFFPPSRTVVFRKSCLLYVGMLNPALSGVDDWDLWIRIAERFPVTAVEESVAIWRGARATSGQGSSNWAKIIEAGTRAHEHGLKLPRAVAAPESKRREVHQRFLDNISDSLIYRTALALKEGPGLKTLKPMGIALRRNPSRVFRPASFKFFMKTLASR